MVAAGPTFAAIVAERTTVLAEVEPYRRGAFFTRKLGAHVHAD